MLSSDATPATWSAYVLRLDDGRLYRTPIGVRGTTRALFYADGTVKAGRTRTRVVERPAWPEWAYLTFWIDPKHGTTRWMITSERHPTGRLDHICLLAMKQGGETCDEARGHLLAHLRLDPRYAPILPALEKNRHA